MNRRLKDAVIGLVAVVWAANMMAPIWIKDFDPPEMVNGVFMAVVGVYFGTRGNDKDKEKDA